MVTGGAQAGTTYYYNGNDSLDLSYEKTVKANGVTEHKHYISLPGSNGQWLLGQFVQRSGNLAANPASSRAAQELNYFHQDAQGSTVAVSDANGQIQERMAYDPWGDRRNVSGPADPNNLITVDKTDRGYTQHEMLDEVGLVHMNGRIYDPTLGRMLTADILVCYPERSTSFNRYVYALNNPLRFVDPSGWEPWGSNEDGRTQFIGSGLQSVGNTYTGDAYDYADGDRLAKGSIVSASMVSGNNGGTTPIASYSSERGNWIATGYGLQLASVEPRVAGELYLWSMGVGQFRQYLDFASTPLGIQAAHMAYVAGTLGIFSVGEALQNKLPPPNIKSLTSQLIKQFHEKKMAEAIAARDALSAKLHPLGWDAPATVTAGYNVKTGEVAVRACGGGKCADDHVVAALGGVKAEVTFTEAVRPRLHHKGTKVDICSRCEASYGRNAFPSNTIFRTDKIKEQ